MKKIIIRTIFTALLISYITGCATNQSSSFQDQLSMMSERKGVNEYKKIRAQFMEYAKSGNSEKLYEMMAPYSYDKAEMFELFRNETFPFFSGFTEVIEPEIFNVVNDEDGNPGYTMYGFINTTANKKKPYAIAIIEKGNGLVVKNFVLNQCLGRFHPNC